MCEQHTKSGKVSSPVEHEQLIVRNERSEGRSRQTTVVARHQSGKDDSMRRRQGRLIYGLKVAVLEKNMSPARKGLNALREVPERTASLKECCDVPS